MLKIAIQKSGRLHEDSIKLLKECGIELNNGNKQLKTLAHNFPVEVYFFRDDDIPQYVFDGIADIGFVGENVLLEKGKDVDFIYRLGFGKCRLSIAVPKTMNYKSIQDLEGLKIATSYANILQNYLTERNVNAEIHEISGSVEIAPGIGLADAICDLVSSGSTLFTNGLKEVETILQSDTVLCAHKNLSFEGFIKVCILIISSFQLVQLIFLQLLNPSIFQSHPKIHLHLLRFAHCSIPLQPKAQQ